MRARYYIRVSYYSCPYLYTTYTTCGFTQDHYSLCYLCMHVQLRSGAYGQKYNSIPFQSTKWIDLGPRKIPQLFLTSTMLCLEPVSGHLSAYIYII